MNKHSLRSFFVFLLPVLVFSSCSASQTGSNRGQIVVLDLSRYADVDLKDSLKVLELWDVMHMSATLQGLVNRESPRLYMRYVVSDGLDVDDFWWNNCIRDGGWLCDREVVRITDPVEAARMFRDEIRGLVVYDSSFAPASNLASTVAGADTLLAVRYDTSEGSLYNRLKADGWETVVLLIGTDGEPLFSSKTEAYEWAVRNYLETGKCKGDYAAYYIDQYWRKCCRNAVSSHHLLCNHDFFVAHKAFFFDLSPWGDEPATDAPSEAVGADFAMMKRILAELYRINSGEKFCHIGGFPSWPFKYTDVNGIGGRHEPVETEWQFASIIGEYNAYKDADAPSYGAMANASFWQYYPVEEEHPQKWTGRDELKRKGYLLEDGSLDLSKRYLLVYVGDFDASAWLYQTMPQIWNDPARGKLPLMWAISPVLEKRAPMVMEYIRSSATPEDYFVAADNGAGYLNPGSLEEPRSVSGLPSGVEAFERHSIPYYKRWGLTVTGFIIDGSAKAMSEEGLRSYSRFSPDGVCPQLCPVLSMVDDMPVVRGGNEPGSHDPVIAAERVLKDMYKHSGCPFYWTRTILKTPSWHLKMKEAIEERDDSVVWLSAPEFFELVRCYLSSPSSPSASRNDR